MSKIETDKMATPNGIKPSRQFGYELVGNSAAERSTTSPTATNIVCRVQEGFDMRTSLLAEIIVGADDFLGMCLAHCGAGYRNSRKTQHEDQRRRQPRPLPGIGTETLQGWMPDSMSYRETGGSMCKILVGCKAGWHCLSLKFNRLPEAP